MCALPQGLKSELCQYLQVFLQMTGIIKRAVASDREGNFPLRLASVEKSFSNIQIKGLPQLPPPWVVLS